MNHSIQFESGLIKVSGIFNYQYKKDHHRFIQHGYDTLPSIELAANTGDEEKQSRIKAILFPFCHYCIVCRCRIVLLFISSSFQQIHQKNQ